MISFLMIYNKSKIVWKTLLWKTNLIDRSYDRLKICNRIEKLISFRLKYDFGVDDVQLKSFVNVGKIVSLTIFGESYDLFKVLESLAITH
jgi:hypothetical protein